MMRITLSDAGKRFNREWIFRHVNLEITPGQSYAITGPNGIGKSTLLQAISGSMEVSEGSIYWYHSDENNALADKEKVHRYLSMAAPYLEVIEEMTALEFLEFHSGFKKLLPQLTIKEMLSFVELEKAANKQIRYYSSGMKQRIKLAQAFFSDTPLLLLDEPCTNLDENGYQLYHRLIKEFASNKTVLVSSNDLQEYSFCTHRVSILDYK